MWNLTAFFQLFAEGMRGVPFAAFTKLPSNYYTRGAGIVHPCVRVVVDSPRGARIITYRQAEFAQRYCA